MGDDEANEANERPRHRVYLDGFELARFPTTNAMFARFIAAGGYGERRWWDAAIADGHWDEKEGRACKRTLVITKSEKIKYSLSNGDKEKFTNKEWAYFQCCRYWVERCFDDCKNELGMSGYQVTGWLAWQHHMALVMIASLYILTLKLENQDEMPLLSVRDARLLVIAKAFATKKEVDLCLEHIRIRHRQRQADIDRYYK